MRGRIGIAAILAALVTAGVGGAETFNDPVGDTPGPDIKSVDVTASTAQGLVITVALANRSALEDSEAVEIDVDLDANPATGDESGIDLYGVVVGGDQPEVDLWKDGDFDVTDEATIAWTDAGARLTVPLSLAGSKVSVSAQALGAEQPPESAEPPADPGTDLAPDNGAYTFDVPKPELRSTTVSFAPKQPRAGHTFALRKVSLLLSTGGPFTAKTSCTATLGGKKLGKGTACSWRIPAHSKGKRLRVSVAASYGTLAFNLSRTFRVR